MSSTFFLDFFFIMYYIYKKGRMDEDKNTGIDIQGQTDNTVI